MTNKRSYGLMALALLALQNSALCLVMHKSRSLDATGTTFFAPTAVALGEFIKILVSLTALWIQHFQASKSERASKLDCEKQVGLRSEAQSSDITRDSQQGLAGQKAISAIFPKESWKAAIPAVLCVVQNNLQLIGASHLSASHFQILSQLKIVFTAIFSILLLGKQISRQQWAALFILIIAVAAMQSELQNTAIRSHVPAHSTLTGLSAVIAASVISGFACVYTETVMKSTGQMWATNVQLATFSILPASIPILGDALHRGRWDPMRFFGLWAWATVLCNVLGGLLVAMVMTHADNIQKGFAIGASIVLTLGVGTLSNTTKADSISIAGAVAVVSAIILYSCPARRDYKGAVFLR